MCHPGCAHGECTAPYTCTCEIGWFGRQPEAYRNEWLVYAYDWVRKTDPNGFFQLPLRRFEHYSASMSPPKGKRQEETIKAIWAGLDRAEPPRGD